MFMSSSHGTKSAWRTTEKTDSVTAATTTIISQCKDRGEGAVKCGPLGCSAAVEFFISISRRNWPSHLAEPAVQLPAAEAIGEDERLLEPRMRRGCGGIAVDSPLEMQCATREQNTTE